MQVDVNTRYQKIFTEKVQGERLTVSQISDDVDEAG